MSKHPALRYLRANALPHIWCAGCGNGLILGAIIRAFEKSQVDKNKVVLVTGIGCWGLAGNYLDTDWIHTTHGRALPVATGVKLVKPELTVLVLTGDGDLAAIGGNHFIHAARRNIGVITICSNNMIYGRTGGQVAPTTPVGKIASTTPYGTVERPFDLSLLAQAAGATYVARWSVLQPVSLVNSIVKAINHKGFSFIEVLSPCPAQFGAKNGFKTPGELYRWFKQRCIPKDKARETEDINGKFLVGEFVYRDDVQELSEAIRTIVKRPKES